MSNIAAKLDQIQTRSFTMTGCCYPELNGMVENQIFYYSFCGMSLLISVMTSVFVRNWILSLFFATFLFLMSFFFKFIINLTNRNIASAFSKPGDRMSYVIDSEFVYLNGGNSIRQIRISSIKTIKIKHLLEYQGTKYGRIQINEDFDIPYVADSETVVQTIKSISRYALPNETTATML